MSAPEPRTAAGKRLLNDVREVVVHGVTDRIGPGYDLAWHVARGIAQVEDEAEKRGIDLTITDMEGLGDPAGFEELRRLAAPVQPDVDRLARAIYYADPLYRLDPREPDSLTRARAIAASYATDRFPEHTAQHEADDKAGHRYTGPERRVKDDPNVPQWEERRGR